MSEWALNVTIKFLNTFYEIAIQIMIMYMIDNDFEKGVDIDHVDLQNVCFLE